MIDKKWISFKDIEIEKRLLEWWKELENDRGGRAELRRCRTSTDVALCPAYHQLLHKLLPLGKVRRNELAAAAGLAAHVKENDPAKRFAAQMAGSKHDGGAARVSGLRFRRLLKIESIDKLYTEMVRTIRLLGGRVNLPDLAGDVYGWNEYVRRQWAYDYYAQAPSEK